MRPPPLELYFTYGRNAPPVPVWIRIFALDQVAPKLSEVRKVTTFDR